MISDTVKYSSAPTISDSKKVDDDYPQNNSESSALPSDISFVRNSTNMISIKKNTTVPITDGFLNRVWRCFQTSDRKHSNGNICDEEGTELTDILTQGENLRQQANSLFSPDNEAPVPHGWKGSLLKRCLVGAGLLTGTGVLGGAGYAGYKHYNHGTSSTEKSLYTIQDTGGSLEDSFGNHALYHDGAANRHRRHHHHLPASTYNTTESGLIYNGWESFFNNKLKKINDRIIKQLYQEGLLLNKRSKYKEKTFYALSRYLHYGESIHTENENKIKMLAQKILYRSGIYGEKSNEQLSSEQAKSVVRYWVFQNILSTTPEKYIESKMKLDIARVYTVNDIHSLLSMDKLPVMNDFQLGRLTQIEQSSFNIMWKDFLLEEMPFLAFGDEKIKSILLNDSDFANLYSGSRFIKNIKGKEFSFEEIIVVGESIWELAITEGVPEDKLAYYLAPALFFNAASPEDVKNKLEDDIDIINRYLNYRGNINSVASDINNKTNTYLSAARSWLPKGGLVDKVIEECALVFSDKKARAFTQENYLTGIIKPCDNAPDDLGDKYTKQTAYVADSFREIDKYLMLPAFDLLPADEQAFISASNAVIHMAKLLVNSSYLARFTQNGNPNKEIIAPLNNTVVFTVQKDRQERIYALKEIKSNQEYYKLIRVDRVLNNYLQNNILDKLFVTKYEMPKFLPGYLKILHSLNFHISQYTFNEVFKIDKESILIKQNNINSLIDSISDSHRMTLFDDLYKSGNTNSELQEVWNVVKHFIPFYDCTNSIIDGNIVASTIECGLDIILFIPVISQSAKLSVKFGTGLTRGLHKSMVSVGGQGVENAVKNILREVSLPTTTELASLGKNTILALDPGFSLLMSASRISGTFAKKIVKLISKKKEMATLVTSLETRIAKLPLITPSKPLTGVLAGTELEIPVLGIGKQHGENIYVKVNPKTGEKFGTKYICRGEGVLLPASSVLGRHKRSAEDTYMSRLVNDTSTNYNRVKRMDNNPLRCPSPLAISIGSQYYINFYDEVNDIVNIPQQKEFLIRPAVHPYRVGFVDFNEDTTDIAEIMRRTIRTYYQREDILAFRLEQGSAIIPANYYRQNDYFRIYQHGVDRAKQLVETLYFRFQDINMQKLNTISADNLNLRRLESYLSVKLKLDTIGDIRIENIIKKESITRLQDYIRNMNSYFNNEINSIYFVTANIHIHDIRENPNLERVAGFVFPYDKYRRVMIMPDFFSVSDLDEHLVDTILHEVSHITGSLDYQVSSGANIQDSMDKFNNVALGIEHGNIEFGADVMEYYQHTTKRKISVDNLRALIRRDPVLRANIFMDNAYFLPIMIEDLNDLLK